MTLDLGGGGGGRSHKISDRGAENAEQDQTDLALHFPQNKSLVSKKKQGKDIKLSQTLNFRLFQFERVCRRQFRIC